MSEQNPSGLQVSPAASDEEMAAILAAYEALWPKPQPVQTAIDTSAAWRFSGRWFATKKFPQR